MEYVSPSAGGHDAVVSGTFAASVVVIHAQVMPHLVRHNSGDKGHIVSIKLYKDTMNIQCLIYNTYPNMLL